jgi:hypothetical protein
MLSGQTGSGKCTALLATVKSYTDNDVIQKIVGIDPIVQFDGKIRILPLTEVYKEYYGRRLTEWGKAKILVEETVRSTAVGTLRTSISQ